MKVYVTWADVEHFIDCVVEKYKDSNLPGVYGLPRGGLIFAVMLSHDLNIPMLAAPCEGCLIVDDICDSGETLIHYIRNSSAEDKPKYHTATMYYKCGAAVTPEVWCELKTDQWIVFPWEGRNHD